MPRNISRPSIEGTRPDSIDITAYRRNIASGTTSIHGLDRALLGSFTLEQPMDAALVDDHRVFHGVTAVRPLDPAEPAHRDVLVLTFRRESGPDRG